MTSLASFRLDRAGGGEKELRRAIRGSEDHKER